MRRASEVDSHDEQASIACGRRAIGRDAPREPAMPKRDKPPTRQAASDGSCGVFRNASAHGGRVWVSSNSTSLERELSLGSSFFSPIPRLRVQKEQERHACSERLEHAVMVAVPGKTGCKQLGHTVYNLLMPLWHELRRLHWRPNATVIYLDCSGAILGAWGGTTLAHSPEFVRSSFRLVTHRPLRSLRELTAAQRRSGAWEGLKQALRRLMRFGSHEPAVCADRLLVGVPCAAADHYNVRLRPREHVVAFHRQLAAAVLRRPLSSAWTGRAGGATVTLVDRGDARKILNRESLLRQLRELPGVGRARAVDFAGMTLREQLETAAAGHVMMGMDGTGLFHACYMRPGSSVVVVMPFGAAVLLRTKGANFVRLWRASGLRVTRIDVRHSNQTRLLSSIPRCRECMSQLAAMADSAHASPWPTQRPAACANPDRKRGDVAWYGCVLSQSSYMPIPDALGAVVTSLRYREAATLR